MTAIGYWIFGLLAVFTGGFSLLSKDFRTQSLLLWVTQCSVALTFLFLGSELLAVVQMAVATLFCFIGIFFSVLLGGEKKGLGHSVATWSTLGIVSIFFAVIIPLFDLDIKTQAKTPTFSFLELNEFLVSSRLPLLLLGGLVLVVVMIGSGWIVRPGEKSE